MENSDYDSVFQDLILECLDDEFVIKTLAIVALVVGTRWNKRRRFEGDIKYSMKNRIPTQVKHLTRLIGVSDVDCVSNLRMDRNTFGRLSVMMRQIGGLEDGKYVTVEEQLASFISILAHHKKSRIVGFDYLRSGETVSKYFHVVLRAILSLHEMLLVKPDAVPNDCTDPRWKWFKGCLGALDGTYISVKVSNSDKPRYRNRKGQISTNTLAVCDRHLRFIFVLPGWEGSAADSRVLRDAVSKDDGLKVSKGTYYLADNGYANSEGFLTPYRGVRYHLKEWGPQTVLPTTSQEMFNMRHSKARNIIERAFGVMKMRWGILRSASYYPIKTQTKLIGACFLLHNFIRGEMPNDPIEDQVDNEASTDGEEVNEPENVDYIDHVESSAQWNSFRDEIANAMWHDGIDN